jgi:hypothetical protein
MVPVPALVTVAVVRFALVTPTVRALFVVEISVLVMVAVSIPVAVSD